MIDKIGTVLTDAHAVYAIATDLDGITLMIASNLFLKLVSLLFLLILCKGSLDIGGILLGENAIWVEIVIFQIYPIHP